MILTPEFWINFSKRDSTPELDEKIISDNIYVNVMKIKNAYHIISCCLYKGSNFEEFYNDLIVTISKKVKELKIKHSLGLQWLIRSSDVPVNLSEKLLQKGFTKLATTNKMGIDFENYYLDKSLYNNEIEVVSISFEETLEDPILNLILNNFPNQFSNIEEVKAQLALARSLHNKKGNTSEHFIVLDQYKTRPIASASLVIRHDIPDTAYLSGAMTDKDYRKKGIYSTLLLKRIERCMKLGLKYLIVDADPMTSGPILEKFGFKTFDSVDVYRLKFNFKE